MTDTSANDDAGDFGDTAAHPGDDALLGELRSAITHYDPPPPHLVDGVKAAFGLRRVDEELAQLVADIELVGVRSTPVVTSFAFVSGDASIELDVDDGRLVGELVPGESVNVTIETADGEEVTTSADARGRFVLDAPPGPFRLHTTLAGVRTVTDWFRA